jgi:hypothetical protein
MKKYRKLYVDTALIGMEEEWIHAEILNFVRRKEMYPAI